MTMQSEGLIRQRLKQVLFRYLQKEMRTNFKCYPENCLHNTCEVLVANGYEEGAVGLCSFQIEGKPRRVVCDSRIHGGQEQARTCQWWTPIRTKEEIRQEFHKLIFSNELGPIAARYPDAAALMWVLGSCTDEYLVEIEAEVDKGGQGNP